LANPASERAPVTEVFDFEQVARRVDVLDAVVGGRLSLSLGFLQSIRAGSVLFQSL
jgi:hypothetical protein